MYELAHSQATALYLHKSLPLLAKEFSKRHLSTSNQTIVLTTNEGPPYAYFKKLEGRQMEYKMQDPLLSW